MQGLRRHLLGRFSPRLLFAAVLCALVLNGVAYLTHHHDDSAHRASAGQTELCGYCATFGGLASAPMVAVAGQLSLALIALIAPLPAAAPVLRRFLTSARPRAPPIS